MGVEELAMPLQFQPSIGQAVLARLVWCIKYLDQASRLRQLRELHARLFVFSQDEVLG